MSNALYTTAAAIRAQGAEAGSIHEARKPRYHLRAGAEYLHFSCEFLTSVRGHAWNGTAEQARACKRKFPAAKGCKRTAIRSIPVHVEEVQ